MKKTILAFFDKVVKKTKSQKNDKPVLADYHTSIDTLPLQNWIECHDGDLTKTRMDSKRGDQKQDEQAWEMIQDSYLKTYGLSKLLEKIYDALRKKAQLELDYVLTEDRMKLTLVEMEEQKIKSMLTNKGQGITIQQSLIYLSQWMNQWISTKSITTREYFDLIGEMEKFNKRTTSKPKKRNGK
jgi:hypothetical protein